MDTFFVRILYRLSYELILLFIYSISQSMINNRPILPRHRKLITTKQLFIAMVLSSLSIVIAVWWYDVYLPELETADDVERAGMEKVEMEEGSGTIRIDVTTQAVDREAIDYTVERYLCFGDPSRELTAY